MTEASPGKDSKDSGSCPVRVAAPATTPPFTGLLRGLEVFSSLMHWPSAFHAPTANQQVTYVPCDSSGHHVLHLGHFTPPAAPLKAAPPDVHAGAQSASK